MTKKLSSIATACVAVFILAVTAHAEDITQNRLFMKEYAGFVRGRLMDEPRIREILDKFIIEHKDTLRQGFGIHPELLPEMDEAVGIERLNCIQGRYFEKLTHELNNDERHVFYETAQKLNWWVLNMAIEESESLKVTKASPPLSFRPASDVPFYIALSIDKEISPYLELKLSKEDMRGLSFDRLPCK